MITINNLPLGSSISVTFNLPVIILRLTPAIPRLLNADCGLRISGRASPRKLQRLLSLLGLSAIWETCVVFLSASTPAQPELLWTFRKMTGGCELHLSNKQTKFLTPPEQVLCLFSLIICCMSEVYCKYKSTEVLFLKTSLLEFSLLNLMYYLTM